MTIKLTTIEDIGSVAADPGAGAAGHGRVYVKVVAGEAQLFYQSDLGTVEQITPSPASAGGWTDTGTFVKLITDADTVGIGAAAAIPGYKLIVQETGADSGIYYQLTAPNDNVMSVHSGADAFNRLTMTGNQLQLGSGAVAPDVALSRFAAKQFAISDAAGGSGSIIPLVDFPSGGTVGDPTHNWDGMYAQKFVMPGPFAIGLPIAAHGYIYSSFYPPTGNIELYYKDDSAGAPVRLTPLGGPSGTSPWDRNAGIVNLNDPGDTEVDPNVDNQTALGTSTLRWASIALALGGASVFAASGAANPTARLGSAFVNFGAGGATATDVGLARSATTATTIEVTDGGANVTGGNLQPLVTATGKLGTTGVASSKAWQSVAVTSNYGVYTAAADANPVTSLGSAFVKFGPGGAVAVDVGLSRSAATANTMELSNGGAASGNLQPLVTATGKLGTTGVASSKAFQSAAVTTEYLVAPTASDANPTTRVGSAFVRFGVGGATAVDVGIERGANNTIAISDGGANSGNISPKVANTGTVGSFATPWQSQNAGPAGFFVVTTGDANSKANLASDATGGSLLFGAGGATALDTRIHRTAAAEITIDNAAGGDANVIPATDHGTNVGASLGLGNRRWAQVNAFEVNTGDVVFTDPGCVVCGQQFEEGEDLVMRVVKIHEGPNGRRTRTVPAHSTCR